MPSARPLRSTDGAEHRPAWQAHASQLRRRARPFLDGGFNLASIDLHETHSPQEFARKFAIYVRDKKLKSGEWIVGGDWDEPA
ncbi:MAG: hypothetical protein M3R43_03310 [Acidobacteriota bacterium]|nr:hypothetical protein [Acidobacteriota bacterium]